MSINSARRGARAVSHFSYSRSTRQRNPGNVGRRRWVDLNLGGGECYQVVLDRQRTPAGAEASAELAGARRGGRSGYGVAGAPGLPGSAPRLAESTKAAMDAGTGVSCTTTTGSSRVTVMKTAAPMAAMPTVTAISPQDGQ